LAVRTKKRCKVASISGEGGGGPKRSAKGRAGQKNTVLKSVLTH